MSSFSVANAEMRFHGAHVAGSLSRYGSEVIAEAGQNWPNQVHARSTSRSYHGESAAV